MAKKSIFEADVEKREKAQEATYRAVAGKNVEDAVGIEKAARTTLSLSLTVEDKKFLKQYAAVHGKTVAGIIKDWIDGAKMEMNQ